MILKTQTERSRSPVNRLLGRMIFVWPLSAIATAGVNIRRRQMDAIWSMPLHPSGKPRESFSGRTRIAKFEDNHPVLIRQKRWDVKIGALSKIPLGRFHRLLDAIRVHPGSNSETESFRAKRSEGQFNRHRRKLRKRFLEVWEVFCQALRRGRI